MEDVEIRYYLDWLPISTLPIEISIVEHFGLTRRNFNKVFGNDSALTKYFDRYQFVLSFDYVIRNDGIYIFRLLFDSTDSLDKDYLNASRDISDIIKQLRGHRHEFHNYPHGINSIGFIKKALCNLLSKIWVDISNYDAVLHVDPVEIEDPFSDEFKEQTKKKFETLIEVLDPEKEDSLSQLCAVNQVGNNISFAKRACLLLRHQFAQKRDLCLIAYDRISTKRSNIIPYSIAFILFCVTLALLSQYFKVGIKTSVGLSFLAALAAYTLIFTKVYSPTLELLQRTIGFYSYASIYSRICERLYADCKVTHIDVNTGNYSDMMKGLDARYEIEKTKIETQKYYLKASFAALAIMFALFKAVVEIERISGEYNKGKHVLAEPRNVATIPLVEVKEYYIVKKNLNLRSINNFNKDSKIMWVLSENQRVEAIETTSMWVYVRYFDYVNNVERSGWLYKKYLQLI